MNPINPVCRPATENEINYGEAKWCAKCTSECDSKGKDELVVCDYFKTNDNDPIVPGCPSLMPHALPGGFDGVAIAEEGTPMPEPKERKGKPTMCNTVGELIEKLKEFDPSTPLDLTAFCHAGSEGNKWVQIRRDKWRNNPGYDKPLDIFVEEQTYDGKTTFCRLSAECDQMEYDGPNFADDD